MAVVLRLRCQYVAVDICGITIRASDIAADSPRKRRSQHHKLKYLSVTPSSSSKRSMSNSAHADSGRDERRQIVVADQKQIALDHEINLLHRWEDSRKTKGRWLLGAISVSSVGALSQFGHEGGRGAGRPQCGSDNTDMLKSLCLFSFISPLFLAMSESCRSTSFPSCIPTGLST